MKPSFVLVREYEENIVDSDSGDWSRFQGPLGLHGGGTGQGSGNSIYMNWASQLPKE